MVLVSIRIFAQAFIIALSPVSNSQIKRTKNYLLIILNGGPVIGVVLAIQLSVN